MKIDIVTLFPNYFTSPLKESLIAKALEKGIFKVNLINLRDYSNLPHKQVDDRPYGGGPGMVLRADVLANCVKKLKQKETKVILLDPVGEVFNQKKAVFLSKKKHLIIICGRYEGVDQRFKDKYVDNSISIGDFVINGGEAVSLVLLEAIVRLLPGTLGNQASLEFESFSSHEKGALLDFPHYTRPEIFEGKKVPKVLISGDHQKILAWRKEKSFAITQKLRPDLLKQTRKD